MAKKPASFEYNGTLVRVLDGDTIVSPSKKFKPCLGKDSVTLFRYSLS